jgi:hypothetical protein
VEESDFLWWGGWGGGWITTSTHTFAEMTTGPTSLIWPLLLAAVLPDLAAHRYRSGSPRRRQSPWRREATIVGPTQCLTWWDPAAKRRPNPPTPGATGLTTETSSSLLSARTSTTMHSPLARPPLQRRKVRSLAAALLNNRSIGWRLPPTTMRWRSEMRLWWWLGFAWLSCRLRERRGSVFLQWNNHFHHPSIIRSSFSLLELSNGAI